MTLAFYTHRELKLEDYFVLFLSFFFSVLRFYLFVGDADTEREGRESTDRAAGRGPSTGPEQQADIPPPEPPRHPGDIMSRE